MLLAQNRRTIYLEMPLILGFWRRSKNPPTPDRGKGRVKLLPTVPLGQFFIFQLRVGGTHSGRILPHIFGHFCTVAHKIEMSHHQKILEKMARSKNYVFFTILEIFALCLVNANPFRSQNKLPGLTFWGFLDKAVTL